MSEPDFKESKLLLVQILKDTEASLTREESEEVYGFITVGEYGLALQTFIDIVLEEEKVISAEVMKAIEQLAVLMDMTMEIDLPALKNSISWN